ncbi:MAG: cytochrome c1 [Gammaproteobacteria bacterium]|nr:MAG: cytochrome c1 [Gammaproteobacteria bacterium]
MTTDMIEAIYKSRIWTRIVLRSVTVAAALLPLLASASGGGAIIQHANNDVSDIASLQRGARNFVNYCAGCHSTKYIRFNKLQEDLQLTEEQVVENLMFAARRTDELMEVAMPADDAERWFGQAPPDLTLVARSRGTDWVYSFLKSFYLDEDAATGANNLALPNASMPHVLWELQGLQQATFGVTTDANGAEVVHFGDPAYFEHFETVSPGKLSTEEYDRFVRDLVNFLDWAGTPEQLQRQRLGIWVMIFLAVFLLFAYLLKVEIWKDIK